MFDSTIKSKAYEKHLLVSLVCLLFLCIHVEAHDTPLLFDYSAPSENIDNSASASKSWVSSSGRYSINLLESKAASDTFTLSAQSEAKHDDLILGYGNRSVDVKWFKTAFGEIAVIVNSFEIDTNEVFVIAPPDKSSAGKWNLLYRTPKITLTANHNYVERCNWHVIKIDSDLGFIELRGIWNFSTLSNAEKSQIQTEHTYDIPLFYGFHK